VLGIAAWVFFNVFEIAEDLKYVPPSREAQVNEYLALDRWLVKEGRGVRVENRGNVHTLRTASEGTILIQSELFEWDTEALDYLEEWVAKGGSLILCLGYYRAWDDDVLGGFLNGLGLEADIGPGADTPRTYPAGEYDPELPFYGRNIRFKPPRNVTPANEGTPVNETPLLLKVKLTLKDENGAVRLVQFSKGKGQITVTGRPRFMTSALLEEEPNARLSWYLLADRGEGDILFIRGERRGESIMGRIFELGNFTALVISALALIAVGFWAVIPQFGVVKGNDERKGKALAERFLAEGRFLKRFGALDVYRARYSREIRARLIRKEGLSDEDVIPRAALLLGSGYDELRATEQAMIPDLQKKNDFVKSIVILKTILERL